MEPAVVVVDAVTAGFAPVAMESAGTMKDPAVVETVVASEVAAVANEVRAVVEVLRWPIKLSWGMLGWRLMRKLWWRTLDRRLRF